jgi:uncharacterized membrane protein YsdA (DUF1294 family)
MRGIPLIIIYYAALNLLLLITMALDKHKAKKGAWRVSEAALLRMGLFGGGAGGLLGMMLFRHKTKKFRFYAVFLVSICLHTGLLLFIYLKGFIS